MILVFDPFPSIYPVLLAKRLSVLRGESVGVISSLSTHRFFYSCAFGVASISEEKVRSLIDSVSICIVYNDLRPLWLKWAVYFDSVDCLFLERGLIRGSTCQASLLGVNSRSSLARFGVGEFPIWNIAKREKEVIDIKLITRIKNFTLNVGLVLFGSFEIKISQIKKNKNLFHQNLSVLKYLHRYRRRSSSSSFLYNADVGEPILLVALQLEEDTQFKAQCYFRTNRDFIFFVCDVAKRNGVSVVFRQHPNDVINLIDYFSIDDYELLGSCPVNSKLPDNVCALNSTFLFESLLLEKHIFGFGESAFLKYIDKEEDLFSEFEAWLQLAIQGKAPSVAGTAKILRKYLANGPGELIDHISTGSLPGDLLTFSESDIEAAAESISSLLSRNTAGH